MKNLRSSLFVLVFITSFVFSAIFHPVQAIDPTPISTPEELNNIRNNLSGHYLLTEDIDMGVYGNWVPIGTYAVGFSGILDGNGHTIRNITISDSESDFIGLFGVIGPGGHVHDLQITNAIVEGNTYVSICTGINQGSIERVATHGVIRGNMRVGGLVGYNEATISNSYAITSVIGNTNIGGLVGYNAGSLSNSYSASSIGNPLATNRGGLVGWRTGSVSNSYYDKDVAGLNDTGKGNPLTTAHMKSEESYADTWDFINTWHIIVGETYPSLFPFSVTIEKDSSQSDPASTSPINFIATFDEPIDKSSFSAEDVILGGTAGADQVEITEIAPNNGTTFRLSVSGMTSDGTVSLSIPEGKVIDVLHNFNFLGTSNNVTYEPDTTPPTVSISSTTTSPTNSSSIPVSIKFSEDVIGFTVDDIQVTNGTLENFSGSGKAFSVDLIPGSDGTVSVNIPADVTEDATGNGNTAATPFSIKYDGSRPRVTIYMTFDRDPYNLNILIVNVSFNEEVIGFNENDFNITNGEFSSFYSVEDGKNFQVIFTLETDGPVTVEIPENKVTDLAGNMNQASNILSFEYDSTPPTVTINQSLSQDDPTKNQPINFIATFSEPILPYTFGAGDLTIEGITETPTITITEYAPNDGTTFNIALSGLTQSDTVSVSMLENKVVDLAYNMNYESTSTDNSVEYDITKPNVAISTSASDITNLSPIPVTFEFSEPVVGFELEDITVTNGSPSNLSGSGDSYTVDVTPVEEGLITIEIPENIAVDLAGNPNIASAPFEISYDITNPSVSIEQAIHQTDPTNKLPILFSVTFSKPIFMESFTVDDFVLQAPEGATITSLSETEPYDDTTFEISIDGMTEDGVVALTTPEGKVQDLAGNFNSASTSIDNLVFYDASFVDVTIEKSEEQTDPTNKLPILFSVTFSKPIFMESFTVDDFELQAPAGAAITSLSNLEPYDDTTFEISIDGMTEDGVVALTMPEGKVQDLAGNDNTASSSSDHSVLYDTQSPLVEKIDIEKFYEGNPPEQFTITFNKAMYNPAGDSDPDDVTNPTNFLLVEWGENATFDTTTCKDGWQEDDKLLKISSATYDEETFSTTLKLPYKLTEGSYRLFVCGSTTLYDTALNPFNNGLDSIYSFIVLSEAEEEEENTNSSQSPTLLPETGFPIGQTTQLAKQQAIHNYTGTELKLEIPIAGVKTSIVGVPLVDGDWDVSWLGNQVGYLYGSAYPTWQGNTVLTGHVWNANNTPGIFFNLKTLKYGDLIRIHAYGVVYTYEVRENRLISETNLKAAFKPEDYDWITLLTCEGYQPGDKTYGMRRMVRAVLVSVE